MRIQTNLAALSAQRNLSVTNAALQVSTTRLSSGFRINRAADDAAGLSIANQMRGDIRALQTAQRNASQAGSVLQIADGATGTIAAMLDRMKELATQAASDNTSADARAKLQDELFQLQNEIDRIVASTRFQGSTLLDGSFGLKGQAIADGGPGTFVYSDITDPANPVAAHDTADTDFVSNLNLSGAKAGTTYTFSYAAGELTLTANDAVASTQTVVVDTDPGSQVINFDQLGISFTYAGDVDAAGFATETIITEAEAGGGNFRIGLGTSDDSTINLSLSSLSTTDLGIDSASINLGSYADAEAALDALDAAYSAVNGVIGQIGAATNRLEFASTNLSSIIQNTMAAESTIRDADMAYEMMQFSKQNVLAQAGTAMLAQANSLSQSVLQLLQAA
jgi:flagellin